MAKRKKIRVFCPICGQLEVKNGEILHPELDKQLLRIFQMGFTCHYTQDGEEKEN